MAFGGKATYSGGAGLPELVEDVSDIIGIVSPHETPLLDHFGDPKRAAMSTKHEWIEDALLANTGVIDDDSITSAQNDTTVDVVDGSVFRAGDLVRIGEGPEVTLVTGVSGDTLTIVRRYGGTLSSSLVNGGRLTILSNAALEGADAAAARFTTRVRRSNTTQIFASTVEVSGSMQSAAAHGIVDEVEYQKTERLRELLRDLENSVINGVSAQSDPQGTAASARTMNGIIHMLAGFAMAPGSGGVEPGGGGGAELTEGVLNSALKVIWERSSGSVDTIVVNGAQKRRINGFASAQRGYTPGDERYRDLVSVYESDYGVCRVVLSRWVPRDKALLLDSSRIEVMPLSGRSFGYRALAQTGDALRGQVLGEYTVEMRNAEAHGVLAGLTV